MNKYLVSISAEIQSRLSKDELKNLLVVSLFDIKNNYSKSDGIDDDLSIIDYSDIIIDDFLTS